MGAKRGDWKSIDGIYYLSIHQARRARDQYMLSSGDRVRIKEYALLGYSVQVFVERKRGTK